MSKQDQTNKIVAQNTDKTRKEIIQLIRDELGMTDAGASTYYYNAQKKLAATIKTVAAACEIGITLPETLVTQTIADKHWNVINDAARLKIDKYLEAIDINEIPMFLRK